MLPSQNLQQPKREILIAGAGLSLLVAGLALNYVLEHHNVFKLWENSPYPISWVDILYPPVCVLLCSTGIFLLVGGNLRGKTTGKSLIYAFAIALPITTLYTILDLGMQFVATGADRLGECPGLTAAAASSKVIPESQWRTGRAVGCGVERRGIFLSYYNDVAVYGVMESTDQQHILDKLSGHYRVAHTHPIQIRFFEKENVSTHQGRNGVVIQTGGPAKLIRVVNIG